MCCQENDKSFPCSHLSSRVSCISSSTYYFSLSLLASFLVLLLLSDISFSLFALISAALFPTCHFCLSLAFSPLPSPIPHFKPPPSFASSSTSPSTTSYITCTQSTSLLTPCFFWVFLDSLHPYAFPGSPLSFLLPGVL